MREELVQRPCLVYILESPSATDDFHGRSEGELIRKALDLAGVQANVRRVSNKLVLWFALEELKGLASTNPDQSLLLHLSAHGSGDGLMLTDGSIVTWDELKEPLTAIHRAANQRLILCMSSCEGLAACSLAMEIEGAQPFVGVVGNYDKPTWHETALGFQVFYHLYGRGYGVEEAVRRMALATDNDGFHAITASEARRLYEAALSERPMPPPPTAQGELPAMLPPSIQSEARGPSSSQKVA